MNKGFALAVAMFVPIVAPGHAKDLETTHLFGFTQGSDVNDVGETEMELEATGRFAKRAGSYAALSQDLGIKFVPFRSH